MGEFPFSILLKMFLASSYLTLFTSLWTDSDIVPLYLDTAPAAPIRVAWPSSGLFPRMNSTVDTADIQEKPIIKWRGEWGALYTVLIAVIGPDYGGANIVHYMENNIKKVLLSREGTVNIEYLPPWSFAPNAEGTAVLDTGDAAVDKLAVLVFKQPGPITVEETATGCTQAGMFGRRQDISALVDKYGLGQAVGGAVFWTKYSEATDEMNCYMSKCIGFPFPFPIQGLTDQPECQPAAAYAFSMPQNY